MNFDGFMLPHASFLRAARSDNNWRVSQEYRWYVHCDVTHWSFTTVPPAVVQAFSLNDCCVSLFCSKAANASPQVPTDRYTIFSYLF